MESKHHLLTENSENEIKYLKKIIRVISWDWKYVPGNHDNNKVIWLIDAKGMDENLEGRMSLSLCSLIISYLFHAYFRFS